MQGKTGLTQSIMAQSKVELQDLFGLQVALVPRSIQVAGTKSKAQALRTTWWVFLRSLGQMSTMRHGSRNWLLSN